ncbi:hypothetical protein [Xanthobacter wiegelii]|uniref:hypothetical protein n=1 Tax=Xanthobacter wiegelii TaxID=3119913 RepID=UPI003729AB03
MAAPSGRFFYGLIPNTMSDILAWVSLALQLQSMGSPLWGQVREERIEVGETEINLGVYRRHVTWVRRRDALR